MLGVDPGDDGDDINLDIDERRLGVPESKLRSTLTREVFVGTVIVLFTLNLFPDSSCRLVCAAEDELSTSESLTIWRVSLMSPTKGVNLDASAHFGFCLMRGSVRFEILRPIKGELPTRESDGDGEFFPSCRLAVTATPAGCTRASTLARLGIDTTITEVSTVLFFDHLLGRVSGSTFSKLFFRPFVASNTVADGFLKQCNHNGQHEKI